MNTSNLRIDLDRLIGRLEALGRVGALPGGGVCRLALTPEDKEGRDLVAGWMRELGLAVTVDRIGNVVGIRPGREDGPPVMIGSHIDTVATGGIYDGNLGVLAGLEVVETLNGAGIETRHPVAVAFFTNEEGARFAPDMMGSAVHQGALSLEEALATTGIDGANLQTELVATGYDGDAPVGADRARCFIEYHIEQGPVLEKEGIQIGAVTGVQGISWTEWSVTGVSSHAGASPMAMRRDAGLVAARIAVEARATAKELGGDQVATVGMIAFEPGLVNVVPAAAKMTVDLRNTDEMILRQAERRVAEAAARFAAEEGCEIASRKLARFEPVAFDEEMIARVEGAALALGLSVRRMPSGAGHDAQMFAPNCPTAMIFAPSKDGLSHNIAEYTAPEEIRAGADVLLQVALACAEPV